MSKYSNVRDDNDSVSSTAEETADEVEVEVEAVPEPEPTQVERDYTDVRFGDENSNAVKDVQRALGVDETGIYGADLMYAVERWQNENGFVGGTGVWLNSVQLERLLK